MNSVIATFKFFLFALWCLILVPPQIITLIFTKGEGAYVLPKLWHQGTCLIFGLRTKITGTPLQGQQVMYVSNHLSYLDIPVMGAFLTASFIAKKEVASWPLFGFLSKLQQTAFVDRSGARVEQDHYDLGNMLDSGKSLILFPEGTSGDGTTVLPFKSRLFTLVLERAGRVALQPFTVRMQNAETQADRDLYCWYGDMELPPHLWALAKTSGVTIELIFHDAIDVNEKSERKELTNMCYEAIAKGLNT